MELRVEFLFCRNSRTYDSKTTVQMYRGGAAAKCEVGVPSTDVSSRSTPATSCRRFGDGVQIGLQRVPSS
ncbi:hypothetical protein V5799_033567 [Amblyomma americanum]|uniref:Uncharacterized protein n=1 Tax=Amblyomma americanum TaxID=6943 RepID=A0AAQ4DMY4_AMBAM